MGFLRIPFQKTIPHQVFILICPFPFSKLHQFGDMQIITADILISLGLQRKTDMIDRDIMTRIASRGQCGGYPAQIQDTFKGIFKFILGERFPRKTVMDAQRIPEILKHAVIDEVRMRRVLKPGRLLKLLDDCLDPAKLTVGEITQQFI
jgi:hypothetical protein